MANDLKIIHFNTQGFQNKLNGINNFVKVHKPDILVITEHFQKNENDLEQINGYKIVNSFCRKHNERGGVAIWAKEDIPCKPRKDLDRHRKEKEFELVSVGVGKDVVVTGAYRPPSTSIPDFHIHLGRFIKKINEEPHIKHILTGDFNIDNSKPNKTRLVLSENDLMFQITKKTHRKGRCIDNFITNFDSAKSRVIQSKASDISDHHPIEIIVRKDVTMIAKKKDSFIHKLFQNMFKKKADKIKLEMEKKNTEVNPPQTVIYSLYSNLFNNPGSTRSSSGLRSEDKSTKSFKKEKSQSENKTPKSPSFLSKVFAFFNPWHTTENSKEIPRTPSKPPRSRKGRVSPNETALTSQSFFSKIVTLISFAIDLFKPKSNNSTENSTTKTKTTHMKKKS